MLLCDMDNVLVLQVRDSNLLVVGQLVHALPEPAHCYPAQTAG